MDGATQDLIKQLLEQQMADRERAQADRELLIQLLQERKQPIAQGISTDQRMKNLAAMITLFHYDPENNQIFETWYNRHETIFTTEAGDLIAPMKIRLLLQKFSDTDYQRFADSLLPLKPTDLTFEEVIKNLKLMFGYKETKFAMRHKCLSLQKLDSEDHMTYAARINKHGEKFDVANCTADDLKVLLFLSRLKSPQDSLILEKLLIKIDAQYAQLEASEQQQNFQGQVTIKKLTLKDLVHEAQRILSLKKDKTTVVESIEQSTVFSIQRSNKEKGKSTVSYEKNISTSSNSSSKLKKPPSPCRFCGGEHWERECEHQNTECSDCKRIGHKSGHCSTALDAYMARVRKMQRQRQRRYSDPARVQQVKGEERISDQRKFITPSINGAQVKLQIDTASDITIISRSNWRKVGQPKLKTTTIEARSASNDLIELHGYFECSMKINGVVNSGLCYVSARIDLLGNDWMTKLHLWDVPLSAVCNSIATNKDLSSEIMAMFPLLFSDGLGCCTKTKVSLTLKPGAKPVFRNKRAVPFAAAPVIEGELLRLQHLGVITPVEYSDFAAPIVAVKKSNGKTRICGDYSTGLNDILEPNKFPLPTPEQIFASLAGKKVFSHIDLSDAFLQITLDDESKKMLTINTHCGLFRVNRLQPGIKTAPGEFQGVVTKMLSGLNGTQGFLDDFIVSGTDEADHRRELFRLLNRIQDFGFKLRIEKCEFGVSEIKYCGHIINGDGIHPDPSKILSIQTLPTPSDVSRLRSVLGAINYYGKFVKNIKELRGPLDELLQKNVEFEWTQKHEECFKKLKEVLSSDLVLTHFDPKKKIIVAADASSYGMGAVLMHEFPDGTLRPITHASLSFNAAEKNYPQVQREALALTFAVKKFHCYIFGRHFELQTDHKPLLAIFGSKSGIPVYTASRLQRYALTLLTYDFSIKYINTESFGYADVISRLINNHTRSNEDVVIAGIQTNCFAIDTAHNLPITFTDIQKATMTCPSLQKVSQFILTGWPECKKNISDTTVKNFFERRSCLEIIKKAIFYGDRIVVPEKFRKTVLDELHIGHPGIIRMKLLARSRVFWPNIDVDIAKTVKCCEICAKSSKAPIKCTLSVWPVPQKAWSRIHLDYAGPVNGFYYLVIVDAFSNWPEIFKTTSTTTSKTIEFLEETFSRNGLCDTIVSDNGTQFVSGEFANFCKSKGIDHLTTAPYNPQSNGQAERFVDLLKTGLKKAIGNTDQKLRNFLACYRFTPSYALGMKSPSELMNNRSMKTTLDLMKPALNVSVKRNESMEQKFNDHHGAKWKEFHPNDKILFKQHTSNSNWFWIEATIIERLGSVNYRVKTISGKMVKAHANQMKHRYTNNELMDTFELVDVSGNEVEPLIVPQEMDHEVNDESHNSRNYEEASCDNDEIEKQADGEEESQALRRSTRANAGVPPNRYGND